MKNKEEFIKYGEKAYSALSKLDATSLFENIGCIKYLKHEDYAILLTVNYYYRSKNYIKCLEILDEYKEQFYCSAQYKMFYWDYKIVSLAQLHRFEEILDILLHGDDDIDMSCYSYSLAKLISLKNNFGNEPGIFRPDTFVVATNLKDDYFYFWFYQELYNSIASIHNRNDELILLKEAKIESNIRKDMKNDLIREVELIEPILEDKYAYEVYGKYVSDVLSVKDILKKCKNFVQQDKRINGKMILDSINKFFEKNNVLDDTTVKIWKIEMGLKLLKGEELYSWIKQFENLFDESIYNKDEYVAKFVLSLCYEEKLKDFAVSENLLFSDYWMNKLSNAMPEFVANNTIYSCDMEIYDNLTASGKWAYKAAIWQYEQVTEHGYELMDAGLLSLAFMRVLELEMNERLIFPIKQYIDEEAKYCKEKGKQSIKEDINKELYGFRSLKDPENKGLMLAEIRAIFSGSRTEMPEIGKITKEIYKNFVLTDVGFEKLTNGYLEDMISDTKVNKYRNPPAHARYLNKKTAYEAKVEVEKQLKIMRTFYYSDKMHVIAKIKEYFNELRKKKLE